MQIFKCIYTTTEIIITNRFQLSCIEHNGIRTEHETGTVSVKISNEIKHVSFRVKMAIGVVPFSFLPVIILLFINFEGIKYYYIRTRST
jgi:hypothetical protein